jgi:hypothetical protein
VAKQRHMPMADLKRLGDVTSGLETLGIRQSNYYQQLVELDAVGKLLVQVAQLGTPSSSGAAAPS